MREGGLAQYRGNTPRPVTSIACSSPAATVDTSSPTLRSSSSITSPPSTISSAASGGSPSSTVTDTSPATLVRLIPGTVLPSTST